MNIEIKYGNIIKIFENKSSVTIGRNDNYSDFIIEDFEEEILIKLIYSERYKNYVLINSLNNENILFNNKPFTKVLVPSSFSVSGAGLKNNIYILIEDYRANDSFEDDVIDERESGVQAVKKTLAKGVYDLFDNEVERNRISIVKEVGNKIQALKSNLSSLTVTSYIMNTAMLILSVVCSFGMTNYLLGLKIDNSKSELNLTTNFGFLICISAIVLAISFILKQAVYSYQQFNRAKNSGENNMAQKAIMYIASVFMLIVYVLNLFYYKDVPGLRVASIFISLLFAGALAAVSVAGGYFKYQYKNTNYTLMNFEYREDFESVLKSYRGLISTYINSMSQNKIDNIKSTLINNQIKAFFETLIGLITAPFLAYGVSNTLAMCFPDAANWVRIHGLRFSPVFLILATFLIVFAFFSFVRGFSVSKQIRASEIIKFDGFHDINNHGVTILGLDSMRSLNKEKNIVFFIACLIILIEFTMNVSYFITEIGGDISGIFKSSIAALVPTAILIAETHLLSSTVHKIRNYGELLSKLD